MDKGRIYHIRPKKDQTADVLHYLQNILTQYKISSDIYVKFCSKEWPCFTSLWSRSFFIQGYLNHSERSRKESRVAEAVAPAGV